MGLRATRRRQPGGVPDVPHLRLERALWATGQSAVVGIDEAGCGSWAGPVTVGAVVLDPARRVYKVRDSKILDEDRREALAPRIKSTARDWGVGHAEASEIDRLGLSEARRLATRRAVAGLAMTPDFCLVDGNWDFTPFRPNVRRIVKGDAISLSIACASIIAKTTRDALMRRLDDQYPEYGWASNKGYPSPDHKRALRELGPTPLHRRLFAPIALLDHPTLFEEVSAWVSPLP